jgi:nucleoid-associated protein YejK
MDNQKDYMQQIVNYIKRNLEKGYTLDALKYSLISQGYSRISVENAIEMANKQLAESLPPLKEKPHITYKFFTDSGEPVKFEYEKKSFLKKLLGR